jgi:hypothetical protein
MCALAQALGVRRYTAVGILESLWHFTAQYAPRGDLGRWSDGDIAHAIDWEQEPSALIAALIGTRWLDTHADSAVRLVVHDWATHADRGVHNRLKSRKQKFIVGGSNPGRTRVEPRFNRGSSGSGVLSSPDLYVLSSKPPDPESEDPAKDLHAARRAELLTPKLFQWAHAALTMDERAVRYWTDEYLDALTAGSFKRPPKPGPSMAASLRQSLRRQVGKPLPGEQVKTFREREDDYLKQKEQAELAALKARLLPTEAS